MSYSFYPIGKPLFYGSLSLLHWSCTEYICITNKIFADNFFVWNEKVQTIICALFPQVSCNEWPTKVFVKQNWIPCKLKWQKMQTNFKRNHKFIPPKSIFLWSVTEFYCLTETFMDDFGSSKQGKLKFLNESPVNVPFLRHRTDIWVVHILFLALLWVCWLCVRAALKVTPDFITLAHDGRCRHWRYGSWGWTFPPIFHYILLLCDRWQIFISFLLCNAIISLVQYLFAIQIWKCARSKGVSLSFSMKKSCIHWHLLMLAECLWRPNSGCEHSKMMGAAFQQPCRSSCATVGHLW